MTSSISDFVRKFLVACTWLGLLVLACRGDVQESGDVVELRDGDPPPGLVAQVDGLRAQGITLSPSEDVGTLPGAGHVGPTGQAGYSLPLDLPPGAGGLAPTLSLEYSSGSGNGLFGLGWTLTGFSSIDRCGQTIADDGAFAPIQLDDDDPLCLDGQRLVLVAGAHLAFGSEYRTQKDPFTRILYGQYGTTPYGSFEVHWRDGRISTYGTPDALQSGSTRYSWLLNETRDRYGNAITYAYTSDGGSTSKRPWRVFWDGGRVELVPDPAGRDDERRGYRFGEEWAQLDRIEAIEVFGADDVLLHTYQLDYEYPATWTFGEVAPEPWSPHTRSTLQSISKCDAAGVCLPATTFAYAGSGTQLDLPSEDLPGLPGGVQGLTPEQREMLKWSKDSLAGDFDGDLEYEMVTWDPISEIFEAVKPGFTWGPDVAGLDPPSSLPPVNEDVEYLATHDALYRVQPAMRYLVVNFDNDRHDDILYAVGGGLDLDSVAYADSLRIATQGSDPSEGSGLQFTSVEIDDLSTDRIYNVVPLDHDGNGLTDMWLCRGSGGYKSAHWVLGLNEGDSGAFQFSFHDSNLGCSIHDEINVTSMRGAKQSLLVVPAYAWDPDEMLYRHEVGDYVEDVVPLDEGVRVFYWELQFDPASNEDGEFVDSGLPRDLFQRWRDPSCSNGLAGGFGQLGLPLFGVGVSLDRHIDLNGDGYVDVLRAELATAPVGFPEGTDTHHNVTAIKSGLTAIVDWEVGPACDDPVAEDLVLRGWINTGEGFVRGDVFYTFSGIPHANFWVNIQGGQLTDRDRDGFTDLLVPGLGSDTNAGWTFLMASGDVFDCDGGHCFSTIDSVSLPAGWPSYRSATALAWQSHVARASLLQLRSIGGIAFEGAAFISTGLVRRIEVLPYQEYHETGLRLYRATSGLGGAEFFTYGCAGLPNSITESGIPSVITRPQSTPRSCVPVVTWHSVQVRTGALWDVVDTNYEYGGVVVDQHGRGLVGFEKIKSWYTNEFNRHDVTIREFDLTYDPFLRDYPYAGVPVRTLVTRQFGESGDSLDVRCSDIDDWELVTANELGGLTWFAYPSATHAYGQAVAYEEPPTPPPLPSCDDLTPDQEAFTTEARNADGTVTLATSVTEGGEEITVTPSDFINDEEHWFIGKPQRVEVQSCSGGACRTRTTELTYNPGRHTVTGITREPDALGTSLYLDTEYSYVNGRISLVRTSDDFGEERITSIAWDPAGRLPRSVTNAEDHTSYLIHDEASGVLWAQVQPNGVTSITEFDGFYRPVEQRVHDLPLGPTGGRVEIEYLAGPEPTFGAADAVMRVRTSQYPYGQRVTVEIDPTGREIRRRWKKAPDTQTFPIALPPGETTFYGDDVYVDTLYDQFGRAHRVSHPTLVDDPPAYWTHIDRDIFNRPVRQAIADGPGSQVLISTEETWAYEHGVAIGGNSVGVRADHTDADDRTSSTWVDADGRVVVTADALGTQTCFDYEAFGMLESVQRNCAGAPGPSTTTRYVNDALGRAVSETDPAFGTASTTYTAFGEVDVSTDAAGIVIDTDYDLLGRPTSRDDNGEGTATWEWDTIRIGMLHESVSVDGVTRTYIHGPFNRLTEARTEAPTIPSGGQTGGPPKRMSEFFGYSNDGRLTSIEFDAAGKDPNFRIDFQYDEFANLRSVHRGSDGDLYWGSRHIAPAGHVLTEEYGNEVITTNEYYHDTLRLKSITTAKPPALPLQALEYDWTPGGDLLERKDTATTPDQVEAFQHDALHRLTRWGVSGSEGASYDVLGNITSKTGAGTFGYDAQQRLDTTHFGTTAYDFLANGNLSTWGTKSLTWTPLDKVRTLTTPTQTLNFRYDADGVRTFRSDGTLVRVQASELFERRYNGTWPVVHYRVPTGDGRIAAEVKYTPINCAGDACDWNSETRYVHDDHLGSSSVLSNSTGTLAGGVNYDPWGRPRKRTDWSVYGADSTTTNVVSGFTGHQPEMEGGLINMRGRMYDPLIGRFASVDPIVSAPLSSQGWTPWSYVFNQPLSMVDPSGYAAFGAEGGDDDWLCSIPFDAFSCAPPAGGSDRRLSPATESQLYASMFGSASAFSHNGIGNGGSWTRNGGLEAVFARNHFNRRSAPSGGPDWDPEPGHEFMYDESGRVFGEACVSDCDPNYLGIIYPESTPEGDLIDSGIAFGAYTLVQAWPVMWGFSYFWEPDIELTSALGANTSTNAYQNGRTTAVVVQAVGSTVYGVSRLPSAATAICFAEGTLVQTEDGLVPIEEVEVGDRVWSRDDETGEEGWKPVTEVFVTPDRELLELTFGGGDGTTEVLRVTPEHPLWSLDDGEWDEAGHLERGELVDSLHGPMWLVAAVASPGTESVYNFEVGDSHTYFVGEAGVWAHNNCVREGLRGVLSGTTAAGKTAGGTVLRQGQGGLAAAQARFRAFVEKTGAEVITKAAGRGTGMGSGGGAVQIATSGTTKVILRESSTHAGAATIEIRAAGNAVRKIRFFD